METILKQFNCTVVNSETTRERERERATTATTIALVITNMQNQ